MVRKYSIATYFPSFFIFVHKLKNSGVSYGGINPVRSSLSTFAAGEDYEAFKHPLNIYFL